MASAFQQVDAGDHARLSALGIDRVREPQRPDDMPKEEDNFLSVGELRTQYIDYLTSKVDEYDEQKTARHYYHGAQWEPDQIKVLERRKQPVITWNRVSRKINSIIGLVERMRSDPKALPRSIKSESGANIATQVVREVLGANDFKGIDPWCLLQSAIDGYAGVQKVLTQGDQQDPDIALAFVIGDEYFYDPKSYKLDFSDVGYEGVAKWVTLDEAIELFPDKEEQLNGLIEGDSDLTTNADREYKWVISSSKRLRLVEHWYKRRGEWYWAFYVGNVILDQGLSPFFDEKGKRTRSFHMFSVAVDHDGDRYGFVRNLKGPQDSLNQSKSKTLHIANSRRLILEKGAVDNVEKARIEWARPDGVVEVNPGRKIQPDDRTQDLTAFANLENQAKEEIEQFANLNVAAISGAGIANISGRAIELLRQPGMAELGPFVLAYRQWKLGLYRAIWTTAQRYWTNERWIRMIDNDQEKAVFMQINGLGLDQWGRPAIVNALGALDVDLILEEGPDVATVMQDTYDSLRGYPPGTFPPQVLVEMSSMPREEKNRILKMMAPQPPNQMQQAAAKLEMEHAAVRNAKTAADARKSDAQAQKAMAESEQMGAATQMDAAELQSRLWKEAMQIIQPPQLQPQPMAPRQPIPGT